MANAAQHREKVERNTAFLQALTGPAAFAEWRATCAFYVAVHLVERLRASYNEHSQNHEERFGFFSKHKKPFATIYTHYRILYDASILARYQTKNQFDKAFPADTVDKELIGKHLKTIVDFVNNFYSNSTGQKGDSAVPPAGA